MFIYNMNIPFSIGNGSDYVAFKRNRILYQQYALDNPKAVICNTSTPLGQYLSYSLKQSIHQGCMDKRNYCLEQCTVENVTCPCGTTLKTPAPSITVLDKTKPVCLKN
jgi:hypothetical protein